ncbi:MAG: DNA polymerase IV [Dehalococcoidia bacterium]|nr:DNA polymerase IV [Dehalococcoidia bacterium]
MNNNRRIALVDLDAFYASVEVLEHPHLEGKPVLIGGSPESRGVVAAASYQARDYGCRAAMPMAQALKLCPHAIVLPTRHSIYKSYSKKVINLMLDETSLVQQVSIDEAYVDFSKITNNMAEAEALAHRIQGRILVELGLNCSIGLASNKLIAKVACETGKPKGFVVVKPGNEQQFLAPLDISSLPGIGPRSSVKLKSVGLTNLGKVSCAPDSLLVSVLGQSGLILKLRALGMDESSVATESVPKSISAEETFEKDVAEIEELYDELWRLAQSVSRSLQSQQMSAKTFTLKIRYANFKTVSRSASNYEFTSDPNVLYEFTKELLNINWVKSNALRLIGIGASKLKPMYPQGQLKMEIPDENM